MSATQRPEPVPFLFEGGTTGVLLVHGFTGSPPEMRRIGEYLHERGLTVSGPLLPGHGTTCDDLNRRQWHEWTGHAEKALLALAERCDRVFIAGHSMGALISLYLAARHPEPKGIITYAPALQVQDRRQVLLPLLKYVIPKFAKGEERYSDEAESHLWCYDDYPLKAAAQVMSLRDGVSRSLPNITQPLLIIYGEQDESIARDAPQQVYDAVSSIDRQIVALPDKDHSLTVDSGWEEIARLTWNFISERLGTGPDQ